MYRCSDRGDTAVNAFLLNKSNSINSMQSIPRRNYIFFRRRPPLKAGKQAVAGARAIGEIQRARSTSEAGLSRRSLRSIMRVTDQLHDLSAPARFQLESSPSPRPPANVRFSFNGIRRPPVTLPYNPSKLSQPLSLASYPQYSQHPQPQVPQKQSPTIVCMHSA
jgi:hypothetical protein